MPSEGEEGVDKQLEDLAAVLRAQRRAAREGDQLARFWVHGFHHWVDMDAAGEVGSVLAITPDILPMFPLMSDDQFQAFLAGYRHAVDMEAAGFAAEARVSRE